MARPTSIRDFQAAQRGELEASGDLDGNGTSTAFERDPITGEIADDKPVEPKAEDRPDLIDSLAEATANGRVADIRVEPSDGINARPVEYDVAPDGIVAGVRPADMSPDRGPDVGVTHHQVRDWRDVVKDRAAGLSDDDVTVSAEAGEDRRFSGAGAGDEEPTSENAQQGSLFLVPEDAAFDGAQFRPAPELANIAEGLIEENGFLSFLEGCKIQYLWKRKTGVSKGKLKIGFLARGSGLLGHYSRAEFLVWLSASTARDAKFTDRQVEAAIFHQLCHIGEDDNGNWIKVGHDFEGFAAEVRVYGTWTEDLKIGDSAFKIARQLGLDLDGADEDPDIDDEEDEDDDDRGAVGELEDLPE